MLTRFVPAAVAALILAAGGGAALSQSQPQSTAQPSQRLPPLPVKEKGFPRSLAPVVEAEHEFAQHSINHGMKEAFLRYAAPDGVIVNQRGPVNAIETWSQRNPAPTGLLTWWPVYADVSAAGDMGWTTGPYEFREKPTDAKPADTGHFFTVWRRQADGSWKFVLDLGIRHPAPVKPETVLRYPPSLVRRNGDADAGFDVTGSALSAAQQSLLEAERAFSADSSRKGARAALLARADETLRMYRQNTFPVVGREVVARTLKVDSELVNWSPLKSDVAVSGDMGYAYGTYELMSGGRAAERGNYARVWKRQRGGAWRVVFQVVSPTPSQGV
jgi:ketosteroid isomerase-like protein